MSYYVIQVKTGGEERYLKLAKQAIDETATTETNLHWPRRKLRVRKQGEFRDILAPIFPGYIFFETDNIGTDIYWTLRKTDGFLRFLRDNSKIDPLAGTDRELLIHFLKLGEVVDKSRAYFDENKRICIVEGALKGLEGQIVKVDRRKQRAKVRLSLYENSFLIDFGYELLILSGEHEKG